MKHEQLQFHRHDFKVTRSDYGQNKSILTDPNQIRMNSVENLMSLFQYEIILYIHMTFTNFFCKNIPYE